MNLSGLMNTAIFALAIFAATCRNESEKLKPIYMQPELRRHDPCWQPDNGSYRVTAAGSIMDHRELELLVYPVRCRSNPIIDLVSGTGNRFYGTIISTKQRSEFSASSAEWQLFDFIYRFPFKTGSRLQTPVRFC